MLVSYYGTGLTPQDLSDCMDTQACPFAGGVGASCSGGSAAFAGRYPFSWDTLDRELNANNRPVILGMHRAGNPNDTHWVLVTSGSGDEASDYVMHDPWPLNGANTKLSVRARDNYVFDWIVVYEGQSTCTGVVPSGTSLNHQSAKAGSSHEDAETRATVTGSVTVYHMGEMTMTVALRATSSLGIVSRMQVWTEAEDVVPYWQPYDELTTLVWSPEHETIAARFQDTTGAISAVVTDTIRPLTSPPPVEEPIYTRHKFLPSVMKP
jgi:hypothetical protein